MAESLEMWMGRMLRDVDEDGCQTASIHLQAGDGGQTWDRWDKPLRESENGPGPAALAHLIEEVISNAAEDWPAKKDHLVMLVALDGNGNDRGRWSKHIKGRSKTANVTMLASESVQHASAMQMHTETTKTLLGSANHQIQLQHKTIEMLLGQYQGMIGMFMQTKLEGALESDKQSGEIQKEMWETFKESTPQIMEMMQFLLTSKTKT